MSWQSARTRFSPALAAALSCLAALAVVSPAQAQSAPREQSGQVYGERYVFEVATTWWTPSVRGVISGDGLQAIGNQIDFTNDLGYESTRFRDLRFVVRPAKKHRIRVQYTPIEYTAASVFNRDITYQGSVFPVSVPIESTFGWRTWRVGYEYDLLYASRGFLGVLGEVRFVEMTAALTSAVASETATGESVVPALGIVSRVYPLPDLAINFELSGTKIPKLFGEYTNTVVDWDLHATINVTNNLGGQIGWRKSTTYLEIEGNTGDLKFEGIWFGLVIRY
jgi:hypothetical protein